MELSTNKREFLTLLAKIKKRPFMYLSHKDKSFASFCALLDGIELSYLLIEGNELIGSSFNDYLQQRLNLTWQEFHGLSITELGNRIADEEYEKTIRYLGFLDDYLKEAFNFRLKDFE